MHWHQITMNENHIFLSVFLLSSILFSSLFFGIRYPHFNFWLWIQSAPPLSNTIFIALNRKMICRLFQNKSKKKKYALHMQHIYLLYTLNKSWPWLYFDRDTNSKLIWCIFIRLQLNCLSFKNETNIDLHFIPFFFRSIKMH